MKKTLIILSVFLIVSLAFANNYRFNGMGGAGLAVVNDIKAITYNPSLMGNGLRILGVDFAANKNFIDFVLQASKDATFTRFPDDLKDSQEKATEDIAYLLQNYSNYLNNDLSLNVDLNSGIMLDLFFLKVGFGGNLSAKALMNFDTANLAVDRFDVYLRSKVGVALAAGFSFAKVGVGLYDVATVRQSALQGTSITDLATQLASAPNLVNTVSGDLSATLQLGVFRVSAVSRNVITSYEKSYPLDNMEEVNMGSDIQDMITHLTFNASNLTKDLDVGFAIVDKGFALTAQIDDFEGFMNIINNGPTTEDPSLVKHLHFGIEKQLFPMLTLRTGLNQGYLTFGGDIYLLLGKIGFAYYGSEAGMLAGDQLRQNFEVHVDLLF